MHASLILSAQLLGAMRLAAYRLGHADRFVLYGLFNLFLWRFLSPAPIQELYQFDQHSHVSPPFITRTRP
jgi:hypothetical protein